MAAAPPPYSPRDARRSARDQARAMKMQVRAQQALLYRRPSFVGPVLLVATGVVALLLETGRLRSSTFWPWYAQWWPALLVLVGIGLLLEYFVDRSNPQAGRRSSRGTIWLAILLSFVGLSTHGASFLGPFGERFGQNMDDGDFSMFLGAEHTHDETLSQPLAANASVTIQNPHGAVQISPGSGDENGKILIEVHQVVHANSSKAADRDFRATKPVLNVEGATATVNVGAENGATVDLKITLPAGVSATVRGGHGDISLSGLTSNADIASDHGDVTIASMGGNVHLQMDHGDVRARDIAGDLSIDGHADDVSASDVKGKSLLNGDFFGETNLERIGSLVHFHSSRTDINIPHLGGELTLNSGDLSITAPSGGMQLSTRSKDIEITDLVGDAHISDSDADVNVSAISPLGNIQIQNHTGGVVLTVPESASFSVLAAAGDDDDVHSDFALTGTNDGKTLSGQVGTGGPHLEIKTSHGDLSLRKGSAVSERQPINIPEIRVPKFTVPKTVYPGGTVPEIKIPEIRIPAIHIPAVEVPNAPDPPSPPNPPGHRKHRHSDDSDSDKKDGDTPE